MKNTKADSRQDGQALIELVVMLVVMLVLVGMLVQTIYLSGAHLQTLNRARTAAASFAAGDTYASVVPAASLVSAWSDGPDGSSYSKDDLSSVESDVLLQYGVVNFARPNELAVHARTNRLSQLMEGIPMAEQMDFVRGSAQSRNVPLLPLVSDLLYDADSIRFDEDAVLVWLKGIN